MKSQKILQDHPVNQKRIKEGHPPATSIWLWGEGVRPALPTFQELYGLSGSVVAAVDLVKGLGICAGLKPVTVPGATGAVVTNFAGKIEAALQCLRQGDDFVYVHIESPDEAGHQGNLDTKIWSIEQIDQQMIGPFVKTWLVLNTFAFWSCRITLRRYASAPTAVTRFPSCSLTASSLIRLVPRNTMRHPLVGDCSLPKGTS